MKITTLNEIGDTCTTSFGVTLKTGQSIDYKSATGNRISMGKIADFKYAGWQKQDKTSVWMRVVDIENKTESEWISVSVWDEQNKRGLFKKLTAKPVTNASVEQEDDDNLPF